MPKNELAQINLKELVYSECRALEITAKKLADASVTGAYRSLKKGSGIEFEEARLYTPSDDSRRIDWKVTARKQNPYIKSFREERDQSVLLVVDKTASTLLGIEESKARKILEAAAFIGSIASFNQDAIGSILFSEDGFTYSRPKKGFASVFKILHEIVNSIYASNNINSAKSSNTSFAESLFAIGKLVKRKTQIFLISDFNFPTSFEAPLKSISKKHDVFCLSIVDSLESSMPTAGTFLIKDPETGFEQLVNFSNKKTRDSLVSRITSHRENLSRTFKKQGIPYLQLSSSSDIRSSLFTFFKENSKVHGRS